MHSFRSSLAAFVSVVAIGCGSAATTGGSATPQTAINVPPPSAHAQIVSTDDDAGGTAQEVFDRAKTEMQLGKLEHARALFDRVVIADHAEQPQGAAPSPLGRAAMYDGALCSENLGQSKDARDRYAVLGNAAPESTDAADANLRRARLDVEIEDDADLAQASAALLARKDLQPGDRAEAMALQGLALVHTNDLINGGKDVEAAEKLLDQAAPGDADPPPQNAAAVEFAKGDLIRARGLQITLNPPPPDFSTKMEARCQSILDAEDAYVDAIKTGELKWAVRAGVRVASLYADLHDDLMSIDPPKSATTDAKKSLFRGAMRLRYRILLEKGLGTLDHTINLETATGVKSAWFEHAKQAKAKLEKQLADEKAEIAKLPYTEEQLKKALDDLAKADAKPKA
jgi:hypothetical protein